MSFLTRRPGSLVADHLFFRGAANAGARMHRPARPACLLAERPKVSDSWGFSQGSAAQRWRLDHKVVTTATDVAYVKAEIASAITANSITAN